MDRSKSTSSDDKPRRYDVACRVYFVKGQAKTVYLDIWAWTAADAIVQAELLLKREAVYEAMREVQREREGYNGVNAAVVVQVQPWTAELILARQDLKNMQWDFGK